MVTCHHLLQVSTMHNKLARLCCSQRAEINRLLYVLHAQTHHKQSNHQTYTRLSNEVH